MTTKVTYNGSADRREVTKSDLQKAGAKSFADSFKDLVFLKGVPQEVNNEYAEALVDSGLFVNFDHSSDEDEAPAKQATDSDITKAGGNPGASTDTGTGAASATTSGTTGTGTTSASTGR